ncbi:WW domain-binding protein 4 [Nerophis lumbriciformis]|uniref:WW domain-binding protein 4 n=1 Tax=Nerophis lumbriciformis TaxID=546530 RepID=UPI002ADF7058|nr:WW domain-binding protein 4-like [Nerophis lumbriciformis]
MADYWKSQPRKFCQYCKCWIADNKPSIEFHERGKNHKENVSAKISEIKKKSVQKAKQELRASKQFASMEEAAQKAYQEDLKRMEMESGYGLQPTTLLKPKAPPVVLCVPPPHSRIPPKKKAKSSQPNVTQAWVEGHADDGTTYYFNTITGESRWTTPEGSQSSSDIVQPEQNKIASGSLWTEGLSPEGYTYWYNTQTGESRWEKPEELPSSEAPESSTASSTVEKHQEESTSSQEESTGGDKGSDVAQLSQEAEDPNNSSRKRKSEGEPLEKEEDRTSSKMPQVEEEKEGVQSTNVEPQVITQEEVVKARRPKAFNPYGAWEQIKEEKDPYASVDLQLPLARVEAEVVPIELPPEPKPKFMERIITSLGVESGPASFKKSKTQNGKSRRFRQRDNDD